MHSRHAYTPAPIFPKPNAFQDDVAGSAHTAVGAADSSTQVISDTISILMLSGV